MRGHKVSPIFPHPLLSTPLPSPPLPFPSKAIALLVAAVKFGLTDLTRMTELFIMHECLSPENAADVAALASSVGAKMLHRFAELWILATTSGGAEVVHHDKTYILAPHIRAATSPPLTPRRGAKVSGDSLARMMRHHVIRGY